MKECCKYLNRSKVVERVLVLIILSISLLSVAAWAVDDYDYDRDEGGGGGAEAHVRGWGNSLDHYEHVSFGGRTWVNWGSQLLNSGYERRAIPSSAPVEAWSKYWVTVRILWLPPLFPIVTYLAKAYIHI
ncbi:MAG TPA: hypothetical protein EYP68_00215 [Candidatus Korarchaeota archaeon]|nr:hypothetical protein [Candidatus Korarchaeota archaeon]